MLDKLKIDENVIKTEFRYICLCDEWMDAMWMIQDLFGFAFEVFSAFLHHHYSSGLIK